MIEFALLRFFLNLNVTPGFEHSFRDRRFVFLLEFLFLESLNIILNVFLNVVRYLLDITLYRIGLIVGLMYIEIPL